MQRRGPLKGRDLQCVAFTEITLRMFSRPRTLHTCKPRKFMQRRGLLKGRDVQRVTFTEITQAAVEQALKLPRGVRQKWCFDCCVLFVRALMLSQSYTGLQL